MANTIKLAHSHVSGEEPDTLDAGEVAINTNNQKIWVGNGSDNTLVFNHASYASSGHSHSVGDGGFTQKNFTTTLKNKLDGIATGATNTAAPYYTSAISVGDGGLTQKNFTTTLKNKLDGIAAGATNTNATDNNFTNALKSKLDGIAAGATNTAAPHYTSAIAVGDGGLTQKNFTTTLKNKLDGIAAGATNTAAPYYTSAISVGDGGLTQKNFTTTLKNKLDGIATGANNYSGADKLNLTGGTLNSGGNDTTLYVQCKNAGRALVQIGDSTDGSQGTGVLEITQDGSHGGGISYNGDNSPAWAAGETADNITFYRLNAGTRTEVFHYAYNGNDVTFNGQVNWNGGNSSQCVVGDGGFSQKNFTTTLKNKLDGIASGATNTSAPYYTSAISVGDGGLTQKNFTTTLKDKLDGIATGATNTAAPHYTSAIAVGDGGLTQKNFTSTLKTKLDGIAAGATNTAAPHYTSAIAVGDGGLTQKNFTTTLKNKLDGIAAGATNTSAPYYTSAISVGDGGLTQKNFTTTLKNKLDGIAAGATNTTDTWRPVEAGGNTLASNETLEFKSGSGISISESGGEVTLTCTVTDTNTWRSISDSVTSTSSSVSASSAAVKTAYDRSWSTLALGQSSTTAHRGDLGTVAYNHSQSTHAPTNAQANRSISDSVTSTSSSVSASSAAAKAAYDRSWVSSVGTNTGLSGTITSTGSISLKLEDLPDMTQGWETNTDEFIVLDNGTQKKKRGAEIFGSNAYNSTSIPTNNNQLTNGAGYRTSAQVDTAVGDYAGTIAATAASSLFGGGASGVTNKGISQDIGYKLMNGTMSVGCVTTTNGTSNEYLRYHNGGTFTWDTILYNHLQNISSLTALP